MKPNETETIITYSRGVTFPMLLGLLFVGLKLVGVIDWSWWYVTMPFWLVPAILLGVALLCVIIALIVRRLSKDWIE